MYLIQVSNIFCTLLMVIAHIPYAMLFYLCICQLFTTKTRIWLGLWCFIYSSQFQMAFCFFQSFPSALQEEIPSPGLFDLSSQHPISISCIISQEVFLTGVQLFLYFFKL